MNLFDLATVILVILAVALGFRSGALPQLGGLAGALGGGGLALFALPSAEGVLADLDPLPRALVVLLGLVAAIGLGEGLGSALGRRLGEALGDGVLGTVDRALGSVLGAAQALLIVWLAGGLLATGPLPSLTGQAQTSIAVRTMSAVLPPPTTLADGLARVIGSSGLPDVFVGLEPLPAEPVDRPGDPEARAIAARAEASTVRVSAQTCGAISTGSGFVVAPEYVVTNAHVVAGGSTVRVTVGRELHDAITVVFDPQLDVALLWAPQLRAPPISLATRDPRRGARGAALGYPGGGALTVSAAGVAAAYDAQGRDIYGRGRVTRPILELRAAVERGDSGGPFVLADGTVGGVVFAEARTDDEVGYALAPTAVAARIAPGMSRTEAVQTGDCVR